MGGKVFTIIPASSTAIWVILGIILLLLVLAGLFSYFAYSVRNIKFIITDKGLYIKDGLHRKFIQKDSIIKADIKLLNLDIDREYRPEMKIRGMHIPGYNAGWFKLRNKEKALLFLTDRSQVIYLPTKEGYSVLTSPIQARELMKLVMELWAD